MKPNRRAALLLIPAALLLATSCVRFSGPSAIKRDLSREVVREVVRLALEASGWRYTRALSALALPSDEYRRFMNFLAKFDLKVPRPGA